jgi:hypothetical protein
MVISEDNEIAYAIKYGDLERVRRLICSGIVHSSSLFPDGSSLLLNCITVLLDYMREFFRERRHPGLGRKFPTANIMEIAHWLISREIDVDGMDIYGQ